MTVRPILWHPDPRLKKTCAPVEKVDDTMRALADDMLATMYDAPGVGLAAPQIGELVRLFVMDPSDKEDEAQPTVLFNPEIVWASEALNTYNEGCLSLPELYEDVTRPAEVRVQYLDQEGNEQEAHYTGLWATCAQHEIDHLNGKLFIDHLSALKRSMMTKKMVKKKKERAKAAD